MSGYESEQDSVDSDEEIEIDRGMVPDYAQEANLSDQEDVSILEFRIINTPALWTDPPGSIRYLPQTRLRGHTGAWSPVMYDRLSFELAMATIAMAINEDAFNVDFFDRFVIAPNGTPHDITPLIEHARVRDKLV